MEIILTEEQKSFQSNITKDLLDNLFKELEINKHKFDIQAILKVIGHIIIIFNRELIFHTLRNSNALQFRDEFLNDIFSFIKAELDERCKQEVH